MAAQFALEAKSSVLCLTHVSPRYRSRASMNIEENIELQSSPKSEENYLFADLLREEAQAYIDKNNGKINVLVAEDFMVLPVEKC